MKVLRKKISRSRQNKEELVDINGHSYVTHSKALLDIFLPETTYLVHANIGDQY